MPNAILNPYPIEFIDEGDRIRLRIEEWDAVRVIHMSAEEPPRNVRLSRLGYSQGLWKGRTLVVETSRINGHTWTTRAHRKARMWRSLNGSRSAPTRLVSITKSPSGITGIWWSLRYGRQRGFGNPAWRSSRLSARSVSISFGDRRFHAESRRSGKCGNFNL